MESWLERRKPRTSTVGKYGLWLAEQEVDDDGNWKTVGQAWLCDSCDTIYTGNSTSGAIDHLKEAHQIDEKADAPAAKRQKTAPNSVLDQIVVAVESGRASITKPLADTFKDLLLGWMVDYNVPFAAISNPIFRQFLSLLNPELTTRLLPQDGVTIKGWIDQRYLVQSMKIKRQMLDTPFKKHITFDLWTSGNGYALLGVCAHYIDKNRVFRNHLLGLYRIKGGHGGLNIGAELYGILDRWGLAETNHTAIQTQSHIGHFNCDNVDSNDICVGYLVDKLYSDDDFPTDQYMLDQLKDRLRLRCFGYIINLAARALIEGESRVLDRVGDRPTTAEEQAIVIEWRSRGPIGKCRNTGTFVRRSPQRKERFREIAKNKLTESERRKYGDILLEPEVHSTMLAGDNDTRWNSVYFMIQRAFDLRPVVDMYCHWSLRQPDVSKRIPAEDVLSKEDWDILAYILRLLEPFKKFTKIFEQRKPHFPMVLATLYQMLKDLEQQRELINAKIAAGDEEEDDNDDDEEMMSESSEEEAFDPPRRELSSGSQSQSQSQRPRRARVLPRHLAEYDVDLPSSPRRNHLPAVSSPLAGSSQAPASPSRTQRAAGTAGSQPGTQRTAAAAAVANSAEPPPLPRLSTTGYLFIRGSIDQAIAKLEKYKELLSKSSSYWIAMVLHPGHRRKWIERNLSKHEASKVASNLRVVYRTEYQYRDLPYDTRPADSAAGTASAASTATAAPSSPVPHKEADPYGLTTPDYYSTPVSRPGFDDELAMYLKEDPQPVADPLAWWVQNEGRYPRLAMIAFDYMSMPSMSDEAERTFSAAGLVLLTQRHRMNDDIFNRLVSLKIWGRMEGMGL